MEPNEPSAGGAAVQPHAIPTSTSLSLASKPPTCPSQKQNGKAIASCPIQPLSSNNMTPTSTEKKDKVIASSGSKKRKKVTHRKPDANKQAGVNTRKRSPAWDHF